MKSNGPCAEKGCFEEVLIAADADPQEPFCESHKRPLVNLGVVETLMRDYGARYTANVQAEEMILHIRRGLGL